MDKYQIQYSKEKIKRLKTKWNTFLTYIKYFFGDDSIDVFQVLLQDIPLPKSFKWNAHTFTGKINQGLFHLLSFYLPKYDKNKINQIKRKNIKEGYLKLLRTKQFIDVITGSGTNSVKKIRKANEYFKKYFLDEYLDDWTVKQKRHISVQEKKTILRNIPYCYLCYGKFKKNITMKEIHAEHIESFISGKQSKFCNILLAHPNCNLKKSTSSFEDYREKSISIKRRRSKKKNIDDYLKLKCLKNWNKEYRLDNYSLLRKSALLDKKF
jgi:hypothetical protein